MKVGQIYRSVKTGNRARIISIDSVYNEIEVAWFSTNDLLDPTDRSTFILSNIERLIEEGLIQVYDEPPAGNPNLLFKGIRK